MTQISDESDARIRSILENVVDAIISIDEKGLIQTFNRASELLFGYTLSEVKGKNINMLMPEPYRSEHDFYLKKYFETGVSKIIGVGREVEGLHKDGTTFPADLAIGEYYVGENRFFNGIVRDITKRKLIMKELIKAKEKAEEASAAKSQFFSNISHELRTPMNSILGFAQLMKMSSKQPPTKAQLKSLDQILKSGYHLLDLINETLDMAKIETGNLELSLESISIDHVLNEVLDIITPLADEKNIKMVSHVSETEGDAVLADYKRLKQVLINLMSNAVKYNNEGGRIIVDSEKISENKIRVSIRDTGIGIPENKLSDIFNPFTRVGNDGGMADGVGIGLAITRGLLEKMGGRITVVSEIGQGSCFSFELPAGGKG